MATVRDLIKGSLRLIGATAQGETPTADESNDALNVLNDIIASWSNEKLLIFSELRETFSLVPSQQVYTIGVGGDFNTSWPLQIPKAGVIDTSGYEIPIEIMNQDQWAAVILKNLTALRPYSMYYDFSYPLGNISMYPIGTGNYSLVLYSWKAIDSFATLDTTVSMPPGYYKALRYNLAIELAPEYGREPSPSVVNNAMESKANIKRTNIVTQFLDCDDATLAKKGSFNFFTGY